MFCVPARLPEAFGLYVIEAMAAGVPVVLPDHGSFLKSSERPRLGCFIPSDEPSGLVNALSAMLGDTMQAKQFGETGQGSGSRKIFQR